MLVQFTKQVQLVLTKMQQQPVSTPSISHLSKVLFLNTILANPQTTILPSISGDHFNNNLNMNQKSLKITNKILKIGNKDYFVKKMNRKGKFLKS